LTSSVLLASQGLLHGVTQFCVLSAVKWYTDACGSSYDSVGGWTRFSSNSVVTSSWIW